MTPDRRRPARRTPGQGQTEAGAAGPALSDFASRVLDVAEAIPPGRVMSYGDIAEYLGEGGPVPVGCHSPGSDGPGWSYGGACRSGGVAGQPNRGGGNSLPSGGLPSGGRP